MSKHVAIINANLVETRPNSGFVVVVVDLLFYVHPIVCGGSVVVVLVFITLCPSSFAIILMTKRELVALLLLSFECLVKCSVALPHGALSWSAVCDCGIS